MRSRTIAIILLVTLLFAVPVPTAAIPAATGHTITFINNCNRQVGIVFDEAVYDQSHPGLKSCKPRQTDPPLCYTGEQCGAADCCPGLKESNKLPYNCPGIKHKGANCPNATPYKSGYENASLHKSPVTDCSGPVLGPSVNGSFMLNASESRTILFPQYWNGAFFTRTDCTFDKDGYGSCVTGDCTKYGWGYLVCAGAPSIPPATKGEFNFDLPSLSNKDWYDVSYVNGFNIAMVITPTRYDPAYPGSDPSGTDRQCTSSGCSVGLTDFSSPAVPLWDALKYPSASNFLAITTDCDLYTSYKGTPKFNTDIWNGYCCPIAEGYVNDSSIDCKDVPAGKTCKTCAGQNTNAYPFNTAGALPNSAKIFYHTCPTAYAYTYNDTSALFTCRGNTSYPSEYSVTLSCPGPVLRTILQPAQQPEPGSSSGEEPATAALLSPGSGDGDTLDFIFNDFSEASGSSAVSDTTIHHIHVTPTNDTGESVVRVTRNPDLGTVPDLTGHAFAFYYRIESPNLDNPQIGSATIEFSVRERYLASLGLKPADVVLVHWDGSRWAELPTVYSFSSNGRAYFSATTPGFSYFAITGRGSAQVQAIRTTLPLTMLPSISSQEDMAGTKVTTATAVHGTIAPENPDTPAQVRNQSPVLPAAGTVPGLPVLSAAILVALCCIAAGGWYIRRWWIRQQNPALFREYD